jgi:hypothetical protein
MTAEQREREIGRMGRRWVIGPLVAMMIAGSSLLVQAQVNLEPQTTAGGIRWVSGGIGFAESHELKKIENEYNLRLLFAVRGTGEYLADVVVIIQDHQGQPVLEATAFGPRLLAQVPAGTYTVTATVGGETESRRITVPHNGSAVQSFYFSVR